MKWIIKNQDPECVDKINCKKQGGCRGNIKRVGLETTTKDYYSMELCEAAIERSIKQGDKINYNYGRYN